MEDKRSVDLMNQNKQAINEMIGSHRSVTSIMKEKYSLLLNLLRARAFKNILWRAYKKLFIKNDDKWKDEIIVDIEHLEEYDDLKEGKIAVYTCVTGNYDQIYEPMYLSSKCDYYIITDSEIIPDSKWNKIDINKLDYLKGFTDLEKARFIKLHPHLLFSNYNYSIWVDGNLQIVADISGFPTLLKNNFIAIHHHPYRNCSYLEAYDVIGCAKADVHLLKKQMRYYEEKGFPHDFGLFETNVLVRKHNLSQCIQIMEDWWQEIQAFTKRDQMSFTYVLWKNGFTSNAVTLLGLNTKLNPRLKFHEH